jgi:hypothetical protein
VPDLPAVRGGLPALAPRAGRGPGAPVELTVDAGGDKVRIEVRDDDSTTPGTGKVVSFELREAPATA